MHLVHGAGEKIVVLDPFMGIGNTSLACRRLGVNCVGFEIDQGYFATNTSLLKTETFD